jgi:16S rRNA (guanine966-N2)-methyltransferase
VRIVGGQFRGRSLVAPGDLQTRPTSERVREAIFNILAHGIPDFRISGAKVLDLFAGTGALGLEALSRGARFCLFVERGSEARAKIRRNVEALGLTGATRIFRRDATLLGPAGALNAFTLAFLDPPYGQGLAERALASAAEGCWLAPGAVAVIEERRGSTVILPPQFAPVDRRAWGDSQVLFARLTSPTAPAPASASRP